MNAYCSNLMLPQLHNLPAALTVQLVDIDGEPLTILSLPATFLSIQH